MKNCASAANHGGRRFGWSPATGERLEKLPQAKTRVANRTSQGTRRAKKLGGVASRIAAPKAPPARLMAKRLLKENSGRPAASRRPVRPVTIWAGKSATVDVMLAARASMPTAISAGSVMNEPPPARAFCAPAQSDAKNKMIKIIILKESPEFREEHASRPSLKEVERACFENLVADRHHVIAVGDLQGFAFREERREAVRIAGDDVSRSDRDQGRTIDRRDLRPRQGLPRAADAGGERGPVALGLIREGAERPLLGVGQRVD